MVPLGCEYNGMVVQKNSGREGPEDDSEPPLQEVLSAIEKVID
jgi:hypothetical protein